MRRLLDINNPIMRFLTAAFDILALSVLWTALSLPVVTMGAASAALYSAVYHHVRRGEDYLFNSFWTAFKENLKRSTLTWLVALAILGFLGADALLLRSLILRGYPFGWFYGVTLALLVLALTWTVYLRFSFMLLRAHPVKMLCVLALVVGGIALALTLPAMVAFIPGTVYWAATFPIEWTFLKHMRPEDKARTEKEITE